MREHVRVFVLYGREQVPDDDRAQEIGYAASFMVLVGSDFSWEGVGQVMHYDTTIPTVVGVIATAAVALDVWKMSGGTSKMVLNGLNRLFLKDVERESRAEAGAFLVAYITGLPCFAFQPNAVEALRFVIYCGDAAEAAITELCLRQGFRTV